MRSRYESGVTLIELVIAIVIISIGLAALTATIINTSRHSADPIIQQQAYAIAQSYMEEIQSQPFCDPDVSLDCYSYFNTSPSSACSSSTVEALRANFDDVCDYKTLNGPAADVTGPIASLADYNVQVTIGDTGVNFNGLLSNSGQVVRIDVDVTHSGGVAVNLFAYKANY